MKTVAQPQLIKAPYLKESLDLRLKVQIILFILHIILVIWILSKENYKEIASR